MAWAKKLARVFVDSAFSPSKYEGVLQTKARVSLVYFVLLTLILTTGGSLYTSTKTAPAIQKTAELIEKDLRDIVPKDISIEFKDGTYQINQPEPFFIRTPIDTAGFAMEEELKPTFPKHFITFKKDGTVSELKTLDTTVLINEKNILYYETGKLQTVPLKNLPEATYNYSVVENMLKTLDTAKNNSFIFALAFWGFTYLFGFWVARPVYNLLAGAITYFYLRIRVGSDNFAKLNLSFGKAYRLSLHALTLPLILETGSVLLPANLMPPFISTLLHMAIAFTAARAIATKHTTKTS